MIDEICVYFIILQKALSNIKASYSPPFESLSIYRWAEQGMATSPDHPFLPLIWQKFFTLFLQKQESEYDP